MALHHEGTFIGINGIELFYLTWNPQAAPRAVVVLVHGFGEHSGRYMNLVTPLNERCFAVASFDQRGHGRSPGQRGHVNRFSEYLEDLGCYLMLMHTKYPGLPVFLFGHSLGSLIILDYVLAKQPQDIAGLISSGTVLNQTKVAAHVLLAAKVMSNIMPTFVLPLKLDTNTLSRIPEVCKAYRDDPLVHGNTSARWGKETLDTVSWVRENLSKIKMPLLVMHGGNDQIMTVQGSRDLYAQASSMDKELKVYPDAYHEVHNDLCAAEAARDIITWLEAHIP
jgi:alpha-beta hydrolase superfamily lysophospholipase